MIDDDDDVLYRKLSTSDLENHQRDYHCCLRCAHQSVCVVKDFLDSRPELVISLEMCAEFELED